MRGKLRKWTRRYVIWFTLCGFSIILLSACSTQDTTGASGTQPTPSPVKVVSSPQPTVKPSPTQQNPSTSCKGHKYNDVCIIDPQQLLTGQPASPDAITPMTQDIAMSVTTGTVTVSQKFGTLYLTLSDEGTSGNDKGYCRQLIFLAFFVTEHDYQFPATSVTCHANKTTLGATLSMKTAKKIDWNTSLTVDEEAAIAWGQYDTRYETTQ